jgi:hypothetical protein
MSSVAARRVIAFHVLGALALAGCSSTSTPAAPPATQPAAGGGHDARPVVAPAPDAAPAPPIDAGPPPPPPLPDDGLTLVDPSTLGWPTGTTSVELKKVTHVSLWPGNKAPYSAKVEAGTRLAFRRVVAGVVGKKECAAWVHVVPTAYVCAKDVTPSSEPPAGLALPVIAPGALTPVDYYKVTEDAVPYYASLEDAQAGVIAGELTGHVEFKPLGKGEALGVPFVKMQKGWIERAVTARVSPPTWAGVDLIATPPPAWPWAFVLPLEKAKLAVTRDTPSSKAKVAGDRARRVVVPFGTEQDGYVELAPGEWMDRRQLRVVRRQARPAAVAPGARWIDVDLDEQTLVAYEDDVPVFATLISTAKKIKNTPPATYRLRSKAAATRMAAEATEAKQYDIGEVPWAQRFKKGLFLHAAYWHDNFGNRQSAGCINLSPRDARWLYDWTTPAMPPGFSELEIAVTDGMIVRVRDASALDPPLFDYTDEFKSRYTADDTRVAR